MNWFKRIQEVVENANAAGAYPSKVESLNNFTPRAQKVMALAHKEAERFQHPFVGTECLLLGLIGLGQGVAANVLKKKGLNLENLRMEIEKQCGTGKDDSISGTIPYTPRVRKVLGLAAEEARILHHTYVGTEHIPLGLLQEGDGVAARVLLNHGVNMEETRREVLRALDPNFEPAKTTPSTPEFTMQTELIDMSKRYDVYCNERNQETVYHSVLFKGVRKLFQHSQYDAQSQFVELEQENGESLFVARSSIIKFCESGPEAGGETATT